MYRYSQPSRLHLAGGNGEFIILSEEGTTQGDNCAMGFYAISTVLLIKQLQKKEIGDENEKNIWQAWFADKSSVYKFIYLSRIKCSRESLRHKEMVDKAYIKCSRES